MGDIYAYSALTTKIRAMQGRLLTEKEFAELAACESVTTAIAYLKTTPAYAKALATTDADELHRSDIERILLICKYEDFTKIYRFAGDKQRHFMHLFFMHYEIALLKRSLRSLISHDAIDIDLSSIKDFYLKHSKLDFDAILAATTIDEFIEALKDSVYYDTLHDISASSSATLYDYELHMDLMYFKMIWHEKDKILSKSEVAILSACYGTRLDLLNIQWIYRSKTYYHMSDTDIYALLIPNYYHLHEDDIKKLVSAESSDAFFEEMKSNYYGNMASKYFTTSPSYELESLYKLLLDRIHKLTAAKDPYSIATINSYLYYKEEETSRIITTIESIRYGLSAEAILKGGSIA